MKITPLEIRQKEFQKAFRGIDKDEVSAFLLSLSQEWERALDENKELRIRIENTERELAKLREVEDSLFKTLKTAEDTGANMIEQTKKETELQLKAARMQADEILNEARTKAKTMIENADKKSRAILSDMMDRIKALEENYDHLFDQREKLISQLKNFIRDNGEKMEKLTRQIPENEALKTAQKAMDLFNTGGVEKDLEQITREIEKETGMTAEAPEPEEENTVEENKARAQKSFFDEIE